MNELLVRIAGVVRQVWVGWETEAQQGQYSERNKKGDSPDSAKRVHGFLLLAQRISFAILLCAVVHITAHAAAPVYSTGATADGTGTTVTSGSFTGTSGGFTIVTGRTSDATDALTSISDSQGNTYVALCSPILINGNYGYGYYAKNTTGGSTTVSANFSSSKSIRFAVAHYTGADTTTPLETDIECDGLTSGVTNPNSDPVTTTGVDRLLIGLITLHGSAATIAPAGSETERQETTQRVQIQDLAAATAGNYQSTWTLGSALPSVVWAVGLQPTAAATPTFTSAPAIGTRTSSSIPINATSDTTGTMYGARLTDGSATPTCDQLEAQTATGGVQYASEAVVATVADTLTFSSITDGTVTDGYFCIEDGSGNDSAVAPIADMYKLPGWTVTPSVTSQTTGQFTITKTLDGAGTVYAVACQLNTTAPTVAQVLAGDCTGDVDALAANTDDATGTMTLGTTLPLFMYDVYVVGVYGGLNSQRTDLLDEELDDPVDYSCAFLTSIETATENPVQYYNSVKAIDFQIGDKACYGQSDPDNYVEEIQLDGTFIQQGPQTAQKFNVILFSLATGDFFEDATRTGGSQYTYYFNWLAPNCTPPDYVVEALTISTDPGTIPFGSICTDPQESALTFAVQSGDLAGLSLNSSTGDGTGTLGATEYESGRAGVIRATNEAGLYTEFDTLLYVFDTITAPTCIDVPVSAYESVLLGLHAGFTLGTETTATSPTIAAGNVISCDPAATTEVGVNQAFDYVRSLGHPRPGRSNFGFRFGFGF